MTTIDEHGRPEPPPAGDETASLIGFLEYQRATLAWKCADVGADGFATTVGVSAITLGGLLKHLAFVEEDWFTGDLFGRELGPPWVGVDPASLWLAGDDDPEALRALWAGAVERSRARLAEALADGGLDRPLDRVWPDGFAPTVRWLLLHMIEEYARHNGHADLIREAVDGEVGE